MIPLEYAIYVKLYREAGTNLFIKKKFFTFSIVVLALFGVYQLVFNLNQRTAATDVFTAMGVLTLGVVLLYFWDILRSDQIIILGKDPLFWIATALLFFYTGNLFATGFYHILYSRSPDLAKKLYYLNYILNILRYIMYSIAFAIAARNQDER
ncbi:hypothetical protein GCM10023187_40730 [Nibrella viscosa]|uniref:Uncharacterized protein n=2 Tax=Nibrella viscosa TaxID=1084524 RepID=A0ABP8KQW4_9BACT